MEDPILVRRETTKSPVHIHVKDTTPVHVHVQKPVKPRQQTIDFNVPDNKNERSSQSLAHGSGNIRRNTGSTKVRGRSPVATKTASHNKQTPNSILRSKSPGSGSHRLDVLRPYSDDEEFAERVSKYEKELDGLKSEVGVLRTQVEHQRVLKELEEKDELIDEQEDELEKCKYELEATETENRRLRHGIEKMHDGKRSTPELISSLSGDRLIKKLLDVELDSDVLFKQAMLFADVAGHIQNDRRLPSAEFATLSKQKIALDEAIQRFNGSNRSLRSFLLDRKDLETSIGKVGEQRDLLLTKLSRVQDERQVLKSRLVEREHQIADLLAQLDAQKEETVSVAGQQSSLKITKAHLQNQLRQKEADCNRMAVQIRTLESQLAQERIDTDHLRGILSQSKGRIDLDKEALKKATRAQKMRATKSEDALEQVKAELMEKDTVVAEQMSELELMRSQLSKLSKERSQALAELSACKIRLEEVESFMDRLETEAKDRVDLATSKIHEQSSETSALRLDNERLKNSLVALESKLSHADSEIVQLRTSVREYEPLVEQYRSEMNRSQHEAETLHRKLEKQKFETTKAKREGETELEHADRQAHHLADIRERHLNSEDENRILLGKLELLDKKLNLVEEQNRELLSVNTRREDACNQINLRLEEKITENASLQRQLDTAITDMRRMKEQQREKIAAAERDLQTRIIDLETQLSQSKAEISRLKREKEEAERKFNSRLYDLNDELQQSYGSNRSLQNYVQFLKASYASSFNDLAGIQPLSPQRTSLL